jgi:N-methylhydantoinase A
VGPESAGAEPGPACYGRGGILPTVTDANLLLGRLAADHFLGGTRPLEPEPAHEAVQRLAAALGLRPDQTAEGIVRVANATMERAIRVISLERGHDPRDFTLVCFGGAGGMHAADLARALGIPRILVPNVPGALSALGMLLADVARAYARTLLLPVSRLERTRIEQAFRELEIRAITEFAAEGFKANEIALERALDVRYAGQGYELTVAWSDDFVRTFHELHHRRYGYADAKRPLELVNVRMFAVGRTSKPELQELPLGGPDAGAAIIGRLPMTFGGSQHTGALVDRDRLHAGSHLRGPALIVEYSATTVVPPDFQCRVDGWLNLILEPAP